MKKTNQVRWAAIFLVAAFLVSGKAWAAEPMALPVPEGMDVGTKISKPDYIVPPLTPEKPKINPGTPKNNGWTWEGQPVSSSQTNCFDYYKFQSVGVSVGSTKNGYRPIESVNFKGEVINENDYPIVNGYLFVRIAKEGMGGFEDGYFIIDEFIPLEKINLDAKEERKVDFQWVVPKDLATGSYRADYFFSVGKKFNLGGLPFSNEVTAGSTNFSVLSENQSSVFFDRANTKINSEPFHHIGNWPVIEAGKKIEISQVIKNTYADERQANVQYDLYYWDALDAKDKIDSKSEKVTISAKGEASLVFTIPSMDASVYFLKITANSGDDKSIINIRFTSNQERPRFNFPSINKFPIKQGQTAVLFSCFHNTSSVNTSGKIIVTLEDEKGSEVGKIEYQGSIPSAMSAEKSEIIAQRDLNYLKLKAKMYDRSGKEVDFYETVYDCEAFNKCPAGFISPSKSKGAMSGKNILMILGILLFLGIVGYTVFRKKAGSFTVLLFFLIVMWMPSLADAAVYNNKSTVVKDTYDAYWKYASSAENFRALASGMVQVQHRVGMISGSYDNNFIGDKINFFYNPMAPYFEATGGSWDTPNGAWVAANSFMDANSGWAGEKQIIYCYDTHPGSSCYNNSYDPGKCTKYNYSTNTCEGIDSNTQPGAGAYGEIWWVAKSKLAGEVYMTSSDPSVVDCDDGMECTALKAGSVRLTAHINSTDAKLAATLHATEPGYWNTLYISDYLSGNNHLYYSVADLTLKGVKGNNGIVTGPSGGVLTLPAAEISFDVTVNPTQSVTLECDKEKVLSHGLYNLTMPSGAISATYEIWGGGGGGGGDANEGYATDGWSGGDSRVENFMVANGGGGGIKNILDNSIVNGGSGGSSYNGTGLNNITGGDGMQSEVWGGGNGGNGGNSSGTAGVGGGSPYSNETPGGEGGVPGGGGGGGYFYYIGSGGGGGGGYTKTVKTATPGSVVKLEVGVGGSGGFGGWGTSSYPNSWYSGDGTGGKGGDGRAKIKVACSTEPTCKKPLNQVYEFDTNDLVTYLPLDGDSDDAKGLNNFTNYYVTFSNSGISSNFNKAAYFQGSYAYLYKTWPNTSMITGGNYSVCLWYNQEDNSKHMQELISGREGYYSWSGFEIQTDTNHNPDGLNAGGGAGGVEINKPSYGVWNHICFTKEGASAKLYLNGSLKGSNNNATAGVNPFPYVYLSIGADNFASGDSGSEYFKGYMDDISIFKRALSACEVKKMYDPCDTTCEMPTCNLSNCNEIGIVTSTDTSLAGANMSCQSLMTSNPNTIGSSSFISLDSGNWDMVNSAGLTSQRNWVSNSLASGSFVYNHWCSADGTWYEVDKGAVYVPAGYSGGPCVADIPKNGPAPAICQVCTCEATPSLTLTATPTAIGYGTGTYESKITWTSNAKVLDGCTATSIPADLSWDGTGKPKTNATGVSVSPTVNTTYKLECNTDTGGKISDDVTVNFTPTPCSCTEWTSCSATACGGNSGTMTRDCTPDAPLCEELKTCKTPACPQPGPDQYYREVQP